MIDILSFTVSKTLQSFNETYRNLNVTFKHTHTCTNTLSFATLDTDKQQNIKCQNNIETLIKYSLNT